MAHPTPVSLSDVKRMVIKLGTQVVVEQAGFQTDASPRNTSILAQDRLQAWVRECAELIHNGREVLLVSSGAVGLGRQHLGLAHSLSLTEKQACAAVGQSLLMEQYRAWFAQHGLAVAQVLLTAGDFADRTHYLNLRHTLETLLRLGVVPIINENDSVSTMELQEGRITKGFGDNDKLSALVAAKIDAQLLVVLTNVNGIYTDNPEHCPEARLIPVIEHLEALQAIQTAGQSQLGRGGMASKLEAARLAAISGLYTYITSGLEQPGLQALLQGTEQATGTLIHPQASISGKKRWIGLASGFQGVIIVNEGARKALTENQASLLPIGIVSIDGHFLAHQVVSIQDESRREIGRGLSAFSSDELTHIKGLRSERIAELLPGAHPQEVIHRDNLVIFEEYGI